ncbi:retrovirus-related pol polyprotein from transposon TNT 1-94 [Tanacetum coccineum]
MAAISNVPQLVDKKGGNYSAVSPRLEPGKFNKWKSDFQENSDDEADERTSEENLRDLDIEFHETAIDDLLALKQAKLEVVTFQIQNTKLTKLNHAIQDQLKKERKANEKWLNSSHKVSQCISEQITNQKKKILRVEQLTESSSKNNAKDNPFVLASLDYDHEMVPKSKDCVERLNPDNKLPNFNTGRILVPKSEAVNECLKLTEVSSDLESSKESGSEPQTPLPPLKNLQGTSSSSKRHIWEPIWYLDSGCSKSMTGVKSYLHKYVEQPCLKVAFVNGLKYNLISISQLCDAKYIIQFDDKQGKIFNANKEIILITPRRNDVYVLDMTSLTPNGACFFAKASESNRTLIEAARTMLNGSILSKHLWTKAVKIACYTQNRSIIVKRHDKTPYKTFRERIPDISYFHVFGCPVFIHNHKDHLGKFDAKADDEYFLGYSFNSKAFRVFNIRIQQIE